MNKLFYLKFVFRSHRALILNTTILITLMQCLIAWIIISLDIAPVYNALLNQMPPQVRLIFSQEFLSVFSVKGAIAFGFNHPIVIAMLTLIAVSIPARHISGELKDGTLETLLSGPRSRKRHLSQVFVSVVFILTAVLSFSFIGLMSFLAFVTDFSLQDVGAVFKVVLNNWFLFILISSYSLFLSAIDRISSSAGQRSALITIVFYFVYFISSIWNKISFLKIYNFFHYYQPQKVIFNERSVLLNGSVLVLFSALFFTASLYFFEKRDIP